MSTPWKLTAGCSDAPTDPADPRPRGAARVGAGVIRENQLHGHLDDVVMADPEGNEFCVA